MAKLEARSPKYPALYDRESGVRFRRGVAEVTITQATALAKRRYMDGILVDGKPVKKWLDAHQKELAAAKREADGGGGHE